MSGRPLRIAALTALALLPLHGVRARADGVDALDKFARRAMAETAVRGASVALLRNGSVTWLEGFGVRDERSPGPVTPQTMFEAASIGKVVAAYGALLRVEDGDWTVDMPVASPQLAIAPGCRAPRLADVLSHRAGLGNDLRAKQYRAACHPPAGFSYAGQGWMILQEMFGHDTGQSAEAFLQRRVFSPLAMTRSTFRPPRGADVATGHADLIYAAATNRALSKAWIAPLLGLAVLFGIGLFARRIWRPTAKRRSIALAGLGTVLLVLVGLAVASLIIVPVAPWDSKIRLPSSLHTSAEDLARFAAELLRPTLMPQTMRDRMFAPHAAIDEQLAWGLGIGIDRVETPAGPVATYWQWGSNPGFQGLLVVVPERGDAIVVLTNTGGFADAVTGNRGGYAFAKRLARRALDLDGRWDLSRNR